MHHPKNIQLEKLRSDSFSSLHNAQILRIKRKRFVVAVCVIDLFLNLNMERSSVFFPSMLSWSCKIKIFRISLWSPPRISSPQDLCTPGNTLTHTHRLLYVENRCLFLHRSFSADIISRSFLKKCTDKQPLASSTLCLKLNSRIITAAE